MGYILAILVSLVVGFTAGLIFAAAAIRKNKAKVAALEAKIQESAKIIFD